LYPVFLVGTHRQPGFEQGVTMLSCLFAPEPLAPYAHAAVVIGHPGHELKVFGWMSEHRPRIYVLTDGSGQNGLSRLHATAGLAAQLGAERGEIFGAAADAGIYRAILDQDLGFFLNILDAMAASFVRHSVDFVAGDASEGFNPTHDLCRELINAAVVLAEQASHRAIPNYEFSLTEPEQSYPQTHDHCCMHLRLDNDLLGRKLQAARNYLDLGDEVHQAIQRYGEEYFAVECMRKASAPAVADSHAAKPFYEAWGERRKAEGKYTSVIRYREHILPIVTAIRERTEKRNCVAPDGEHIRR
jgi:hypothetical protein